MSIVEIKESVRDLPIKDRRELVAYLVHLEQIKDSDYIEKITQKVDESDKFMRWDDIKDEFADD